MSRQTHSSVGITGVKTAPGFSLVEMMIVLLISGLLFFVALPGYRGVVLKAARTAGKGVLISVMARQEQYFINRKRYALSLVDLGLPSPYYVDKQAEPVNAARAVYRIELDVEADEYLGVKAVPQNNQLQDSACMTFTISRIGVRSVSGGSASSHPRQCW
jgi:type IV pilus assembly protein PilE